MIATLQTFAKNSQISHTNRAGATKTAAPIHSAAEHTSAACTPKSAFSVAVWVQWIFDKVAAVRNMKNDATLRQAITAELLRRNYQHEDAIAAELYLLTADFPAVKIQTGLQISDFFRDNIEISKQELTAIRHKAFQSGIVQGSKQHQEQTKPLPNDEKPLLTALTVAQNKNAELIEVINQKNAEIVRLSRRLERIKQDFPQTVGKIELEQVAESCEEINTQEAKP